MKKLLVFATIFTLFASLYAQNLIGFSKEDNFEKRVGHHGGYSIPCYKCHQATTSYMKGYAGCLGCPTWRNYDFNIDHWEMKYNKDKKYYELIKVKGNHDWMLYRCQSGHRCYVSIHSDEQR